MNEIDYKKMAEYNEKRKAAAQISREVFYYEHATLICALFDMKWTHRDILGFLHEDVMKDVVHSKRINNKTLSSYRVKWVKSDMVDVEEVEKEIGKLREIFGEKQAPVRRSRGDSATLFGVSYSVLTFMKELEKKGVIVAIEKDGIKTFYEDNAKNTDLDSLVESYLSEKTSFMRG